MKNLLLAPVAISSGDRLTNCPCIRGHRCDSLANIGNLMLVGVSRLLIKGYGAGIGFAVSGAVAQVSASCAWRFVGLCVA